MAEMQQRLSSDQELAESVPEAHELYLRRRESIAGV